MNDKDIPGHKFGSFANTEVAGVTKISVVSQKTGRASFRLACRKSVHTLLCHYGY